MLSLALGFGLKRTFLGTGRCSKVLVNPIPSYKKLLGYYGGENIDGQPKLDCAVLAWLIVSFRTALEYQEEAGDVVVRSLILLFKIASRVLEQDNDGGSSMVACRAVYEGMLLPDAAMVHADSI